MIKMVFYPKSSSALPQGVSLHPHYELGPGYPVAIGWYLEGKWMGWL